MVVQLHSFLILTLDRRKDWTTVLIEYESTWASDSLRKFLLKCKFLLLWQDFGASCIFPVYAGLMCDTEKQYILDVHNNLRRRVAKGLETMGNPGPQPPAANMRKLVSEISLAVCMFLINYITKIAFNT
jgi:hypothetical protein